LFQILKNKKNNKYAIFKKIIKILNKIQLIKDKKVKNFKNGKTKLLGFFVGQLMKRTKGKADPKLANKLLMEKLNS